MAVTGDETGNKHAETGNRAALSGMLRVCWRQSGTIRRAKSETGLLAFSWSLTSFRLRVFAVSFLRSVSRWQTFAERQGQKFHSQFGELRGQDT